MDELIGARNDIEIANGTSTDLADYFLLRSIAQSLIVLTERLDRIDDALRNTVGGSPR